MADKSKKKKSAAQTEAPRATRPASDGKKPTPPPPQDPANYMVPAALGLAVAGAIGFWAKSNMSPPEPAAMASSSDRAQGGTAMRPPPEPSGGFVLPTPQPAPPGSAEPLVATHPEPSSPDPRGGRFGLSDATAGLPAGDGLVAEIETNYGTFSCQLWPDRAPNTVANFVGLARGLRDFWDPVAGAWVRRPYFDGTIFHRVIPGFMAQGGDILRNGRGGPGYEFADENTGSHDQPGMLCMANHGPNTNGSQFFVLEQPKSHLDGSYSVFGKCAPVELVRRITGVPRSPSDRPNEPVVIRHVRVRR